MVLYRIAQEALNNSLKYAEAGNITIELLKSGGKIILRISDDGKGMDLQAAENAEGIGRKNMRSRVELMNGKLEIQSAPGKGTLIEIRIKGT